jgi:hypothetical protein
MSFVSENRFSVLDPDPVPEYAPLIIMEVLIDTGVGWANAYALVDGGAQGNMMNAPFVKEHGLATKPKEERMKLILANGKDSTGGDLVDYCPTTMRTGDHTEKVAFDISTIAYDLILGRPWIEKHDPAQIRSQRRLMFTSDYCKSHCLTPGASVEAPVIPPRPEAHFSPKNVDGQVTTKCDQVATECQQDLLGEEFIRRGKGGHPRTGLPPRGLRVSSRKSGTRSVPSGVDPVDEAKPVSRPLVSLVNAAAFALDLKKGATLFTISAQQFREISSMEDSTDLTEKASAALANIPDEYKEFLDVFSETEANKLPDHRPYDHRIDIPDGSTPPFGPIYNLSPTELDALKEYLDKNLARGFIRHSQSPCAAPILFVKKADGSLRLCVDYRGLNKLTKKNRYPLPLINELLDRLAGAKFFTKFDMREAYHLLRIALGDEWKTAFRCRYGLFEYLVMSFGLCNAPGSFQHFVNDAFREFLDVFLLAYLDDLLIFSKTLKEHKRHVRQVLEKCKELGVHLKAEKCVFHAEEVPFVGFLVSAKGVRMDPSKISAIVDWPTPTSAHDILVFLGFANFYRRFIGNYSKIAQPMTSLLKKGVPFEWGTDAQKSFDTLKTAFTTAPVLAHFDPNKPAIIEADSCDVAEGGILSQYGNDGILHPCAFFSRKFNPAELNYEIYDKELMVIVDCLEEWRHHLEGSGHQVKIYTDHKNLLWFTETKRYNRRQARWALSLSRFDFTITYRQGTKQGKPDALSRRPDYGSHKRGDRAEAYEETQILKPSQLLASASHSQISNIDVELAQDIKNALPNDPNIGPYLGNLRDNHSPEDADEQAYLEPFAMEDGLVLKDGLVYIPDDNRIKVKILKACHDSTTAGHPGEAKTLELLTRDYFWPRMRQFVNEYVKSCETCARNKTPRHRPHGQLHPLPIPPGPWSSVSMDYIVELPSSSGFDAVYVCVDRFTKMAHFIPTTTHVTAEESANLYLRHVFKNHGLPTDIVSDRGTQFTSRFSSALLELCGIKSNKSTAFHPQSDGQTERVNQVLEQYIRIFCGYQQDDWSDLLPLAEFAYNNAQHASTGMSPFFANYGYNPRAILRVTTTLHPNPRAEEFLDRLKATHDHLRRNLKEAQSKYKDNYDVKRKDKPPFKVGDMVWLLRRNIKTTRPSAKLDFKRLGPYRISTIVGESQLAYKLELPTSMRIHPVFHVSLLEPYRTNTIPGRVQPPPPPIEVEGEEEFEVEEILDSRIRNGKLHYLVDWLGYGPSDRTWEPAESLRNAPESVARFHSRHPGRPNPADATRRPSRRGNHVRFDEVPQYYEFQQPIRLAGARPQRGTNCHECEAAMVIAGRSDQCRAIRSMPSDQINAERSDQCRAIRSDLY